MSHATCIAYIFREMQGISRSLELNSGRALKSGAGLGGVARESRPARVGQEHGEVGHGWLVRSRAKIGGGDAGVVVYREFFLILRWGVQGWGMWCDGASCDFGWVSIMGVSHSRFCSGIQPRAEETLEYILWVILADSDLLERQCEREGWVYID